MKHGKGVLPRTDDLSFLIRSGKALIFSLLAMVCLIVAVNNGTAAPYDIPAWYVLLPVMVCLLAENAVKIWGLKQYTAKIVCYVLDILLLLTITVFTDGNLISTLYIIILSEFYLEQEKLSGCIAMGASSIGTFLITLALSNVLKNEAVGISALLAGSFNDFILLVMHFLIFNFAVQIFRKNRELQQTLEELNVTNAKLLRAGEELKEITALEERQRIAKEIHDTVGHAITAVIMQTEAARLTMDEDPEGARRKIDAANFQAKQALEQLRDSVHLLSGYTEGLSLKTELENIVRDSAEGTGIVIRAEIEEIELGGEKRRLLCNSLKEGISNGLRHGGATAFWFELKREGGMVRFLLSDNGTGIEVGALREGYGLSGMRARAEALGGTVWFVSEREEGFEVHISLPCDEEKGETV